MLRLPKFKLRRASSVSEAASILANEVGETRLVAGGTDLWPNMKRRHQSADTVVLLQGISELQGVTGEAGGELRIGATTTLHDVVENKIIRQSYPALARAVQSISSPALRNMGTLGGNLCLDTRCNYYNQSEEWRRSIDYCMKECGSTCWVAPSSSRCWAVSSSDSAPILCAMGARVRIKSVDGERVMPVSEMFLDDGVKYLNLAAGEVLVDVLLPGAQENASAAFWKLRRRGSIDFAVLSVAVQLQREANGVVKDLSIYLGAVASYPIRATEAENLLRGQVLTVENLSAAGEAARKAGTPLNNTDYIPQWRGKMIARYTEAALRDAAGMEMERFAPRHGYGLS